MTGCSDGGPEEAVEVPLILMRAPISKLHAQAIERGRSPAIGQLHDFQLWMDLWRGPPNL